MPGGRPKKKIDEEQLWRLCVLQSPLEEIADFFGVNKSTIQRFCKNEMGNNFETISKQGRAEGKTGLRANQFRLSKTSAAIAIFLGKNYLDQKDDKSSIDPANASTSLCRIASALDRADTTSTTTEPGQETPIYNNDIGPEESQDTNREEQDSQSGDEK